MNTGEMQSDTVILPLKYYRGNFYMINQQITKKVYDVTVLILTYNSSIRKLLMTLNSIILQNNISVQIVISDDGSDVIYREQLLEAKDYLDKKDFHNYKINFRKENSGMVAGMYDSLPLCDGKYIKALGPGDMLYGRDILRNWVNYMEENNLVLSYSDAVYYRWQNDKAIPVRAMANPQRTGGDGITGCIYQLVFDDIWVGAAELLDAKKAYEYIAKIYPQVIYAEDHIYRLMTYCGERFGHFSQKAILYEHGTGVSTKGEAAWKERLKKDWLAADEVLMAQRCYNPKLQTMVEKRMAMRKDIEKTVSENESGGLRFRDRFRRTVIYMRMPRLFLYLLSIKLFPRYTTSKADEAIIRDMVTF